MFCTSLPRWIHRRPPAVEWACLGTLALTLWGGCDSKSRRSPRAPGASGGPARANQAASRARSDGPARDDDAGRSSSGSGANTAVAASSGAAKAPTRSDLSHHLEGIPGGGPQLIAVLRTSEGDVHCRLAHQRAPVTVANFV
ncbi:MAG: hypothetical protein ABEL76_06200, partial [Bradymonadaceae bacterium]